MSAEPAPPAQPTLEAVAAELRVQRWHLAFSPVIEARYEADQAAERTRGLVLGGLAALLVYNLFLVNDRMVRPEVFEQAMLWRLGCMSSYGAVVLCLIQRGLPPRWREAAMASTLIVAVFASSAILWHTRSAAATYDLFVFSLIFMAGNIVYPLRFVPALVSSVLALGVASGFALAHPVFPADALPFALGLLTGTAVFSVLACRRIEAAARRSYLLALREELRSQAALQSAEQFARLSQTDPLTQLANRRAFDTALLQRWQEARDQRQGLALLLIDIDHFKRFNDRWGHPAGDACLQQVARALTRCMGDGDLLARIGGEEFVVLLPRSNQTRALAMAERLRHSVESLALPHDGLAGHRVVTISVGMALAARAVAADATDPAALVSAADQALYQAKRDGRNRCVSADSLLAA